MWTLRKGLPVSHCYHTGLPAIAMRKAGRGGCSPAMGRSAAIVGAARSDAMSCLAIALFRPKYLCVSDPGVADWQIVAKRVHPPCNALRHACSGDVTRRPKPRPAPQGSAVGLPLAGTVRSWASAGISMHGVRSELAWRRCQGTTRTSQSAASTTCLVTPPNSASAELAALLPTTIRSARAALAQLTSACAA